ncbi:MAG: hypothetical protein WBQ66_00040 [Blastocatellia bacterium]|jgi:hypothetical protein
MTSTFLNRPFPGARAGVVALAMSFAVLAVGCESEPTRNGNRPIAPVANDNSPAPGDPGSTLVLKHSTENPIATIPSEFPGVESRLVTVSRRGQMLLVEIELVNTGAGPATIENYSAADATFIDDVSKTPMRPFDTGTGPIATTGLTRTLQPGESATVSASFPVGPTSKLATLTFPKLGIFTAIEIDKGSRYRNKTREEFNAENGGNRRTMNRNAKAAR